MRSENRAQKTIGEQGQIPEDGPSPIFWCRLCPGPVYTPYMVHYRQFHPDWQKVDTSDLKRDLSAISTEAICRGL